MRNILIFRSKEFLRLAEECIQCFQQCLKLDDQIVLVSAEFFLQLISL